MACLYMILGYTRICIIYHHQTCNLWEVLPISVVCALCVYGLRTLKLLDIAPAQLSASRKRERTPYLMHLWPRHYKLISVSAANPNFQSILFIISPTSMRDQSRSSCRKKKYNNLYVGGTTLKELRFHIDIIQVTYRDMNQNSGRNSQQCQWHRTRVTEEIWHLAPNVHKALSDAQPSSPTNSPPKRHFVRHQCPFSFFFS